ncbi:MAG: hypothetical protein LBC56_08000 [Oscillospiraceae bacterium]|jgi:regulator of protease activity HflC (stomatin/prohibitin superfamily)|nr:hypothetical protein [Oscillospiraceae bacterium]
MPYKEPAEKINKTEKTVPEKSFDKSIRQPSAGGKKFVKFLKRLLVFIIVTGAAGLLVWQSIAAVPVSHTGLILRFGRLRQSVYQEGLHFKIPFADKLVLVSNQLVSSQVSAEARTKDAYSLAAEISLSYHVEQDSSSALYQKTNPDAYGRNVLLPLVRESFKNLASDYSAAELAEKRQEFAEKLGGIIQGKIQPDGVKTDVFSLVELNLEEKYYADLDARKALDQEKARQALELENQRAKEELEIELEKERAEQIFASAKAQADGIRLIQEALLASPDFVNYVKWNRWDGKLPLVVASGSDIHTLIDAGDFVPQDALQASEPAGAPEGYSGESFIPDMITGGLTR